ncbi:esterase [Gossypium arboreum]|uniref:Esterase n=1 Tax=Gossypium arboreum TaxID=29729 RepID=A0A0B0MHG9_GOSAR|nr:esterase [Gossypium arboreum]
MGKKGSGWFSTVKKVFKSSRKNFPDKKFFLLPFDVCLAG